MEVPAPLGAVVVAGRLLCMAESWLWQASSSVTRLATGFASPQLGVFTYSDSPPVALKPKGLSIEVLFLLASRCLTIHWAFVSEAGKNRVVGLGGLGLHF